MRRDQDERGMIAGRADGLDDDEHGTNNGTGHDEDPVGGANDDEDLDEDFSAGDGTADGEAVITCPYCGESIEIALDAGGGARQDYVEDCEVCCQPWHVSVQYQADGSADVQVTALDE